MTDSPPHPPPPSRWYARVPGPLQRLFDTFPLVTYPPNELPEGSPAAGRGPAGPGAGASQDLPALHVFILEEDAPRGRPSFNPSCLKWQTFLRIAGVRVRLVPSTNHASPSGALPFLQPGREDGDDHDPSAPAPAPVPASRLHGYALARGAAPLAPEPAAPRAEAYRALLDRAVRRAWLRALYLDPRHAALLARLYAAPASRSGLVRAALLRQLRLAAAAEVARGGGGAGGAGGAGDEEEEEERLYAEAAEALAALEALLADGGEGGGGGEWFFGAGAPTLFDASVFAYTHLLLGGAGLDWGGGGGGGGGARLRDAVRRLPGLVAHRERIWARYWADQG